MSEQLQAIATVLSLVNPAICAAMFARAEAGRTAGQKLADATRAALAILLVLVVAALVGTRLLHVFGVSLDAFMVAGGGVLAWMGFSMLSRPPAASAPVTPGSSPKESLSPLVLFAASPGTITGVITLSAAHTQLHLPVTALVAIGIATLCTWLAMLLVARVSGKGEEGGPLRDALTRFMGLIVLSMGVQFALTGAQRYLQIGSVSG